MSSEMSDRELRSLLRSVPEEAAPPMPRLRLPPRPALAPALPVWALWCVGIAGAVALLGGVAVSWWLLHGGLGTLIGDLAALSVQTVPAVARGLGFSDAILAGALIALMLTPLRATLAPHGR